jgi:hypothetical protein
MNLVPLASLEVGKAPAELVEAQRVQREIERTVGEIVKRSAIPTSASMIPERPAPISEPPTATPGWRKDIPIEMPGGATTQKLIEEMCNSALPHGVKPKK